MIIGIIIYVVVSYLFVMGVNEANRINDRPYMNLFTLWFAPITIFVLLGMFFGNVFITLNNIENKLNNLK